MEPLPGKVILKAPVPRTGEKNRFSKGIILLFFGHFEGELKLSGWDDCPEGRIQHCKVDGEELDSVAYTSLNARINRS